MMICGMHLYILASKNYFNCLSVLALVAVIAKLEYCTAKVLPHCTIVIFSHARTHYCIILPTTLMYKLLKKMQ
jgi:hypothetical protein